MLSVAKNSNCSCCPPHEHPWSGLQVKAYALEANCLLLGRHPDCKPRGGGGGCFKVQSQQEEPQGPGYYHDIQFQGKEHAGVPDSAVQDALIAFPDLVSLSLPGTFYQICWTGHPLTYSAAWAILQVESVL